MLLLYINIMTITGQNLCKLLGKSHTCVKIIPIKIQLHSQLERFLRKNILAVYFLHNLAIHFNNYYKYKTDFIYLSLNHPSVKTIISFVYTF